MGEALFATEVLISAVVLSAGLFVAVTVLRRRAMARNADLVLCGLRLGDGARVRTGILRLTVGELEWFHLFGVTARAAHRWERHGLDFGPPVATQAEARTGLGMVAAVTVDVVARSGPEDRRFQVVLPLSAYPAVRAWAEAAPPSPRPYDC